MSLLFVDCGKKRLDRTLKHRLTGIFAAGVVKFFDE